MPVIRTYSGREFDVYRPRWEMVDETDIARRLGGLDRFGGQCPAFYSVAQHSCLVAERFRRPEMRLMALLHDAGEAYLHDAVRPIKGDVYYLIDGRFVPMVDVEARILAAVFERYGLEIAPLPAAIVNADDEQCALELEWMERGAGATPTFTVELWGPEEAESRWLEEFNRTFCAS